MRPGIPCDEVLLDTNAWIEVLNHPSGALAGKLAAHSPGDIALSSVVLAELLVGAYKSSRTAANLALIHQLTRQFVCLPFDEAAADSYAQTRCYLEKSGQIIGPFDLQIAAIGLHYNLIVVTQNAAEFARVPNLTIENWQTP